MAKRTNQAVCYVDMNDDWDNPDWQTSDLIENFTVGNALRIPADEVMRILTERGRAKTQAREAAATADDRRRARAARTAGLL